MDGHPPERHEVHRLALDRGLRPSGTRREAVRCANVRAMLMTHARLRTAALAAALALLAPSAHAQLRLTRTTPAVIAGPDSAVKAVLNGGSARLVTEPTPDPAIPTTYQTKAERTNWHQTGDYDETLRLCRLLEVGSRSVKVEMFARSGQGRDLPLVIALGVVGTAVGSLLYIYAVAEAGAARAVILNSTSPLMVVPLSMFFLGERPTRLVGLGTACCLVGTLIVVAAG